MSDSEEAGPLEHSAYVTLKKGRDAYSWAICFPCEPGDLIDEMHNAIDRAVEADSYLRAKLIEAGRKP